MSQQLDLRQFKPGAPGGKEKTKPSHFVTRPKYPLELLTKYTSRRREIKAINCCCICGEITLCLYEVLRGNKGLPICEDCFKSLEAFKNE